MPTTPRTHAQFTLVRGALENASRAVWLLESDDRQVRAPRRLRQAQGELIDLEQVRKLTDQPVRRSQAERLDELAGRARAAGIDPTLAAVWYARRTVTESRRATEAAQAAVEALQALMTLARDQAISADRAATAASDAVSAVEDVVRAARETVDVAVMTHRAHEQDRQTRRLLHFVRGVPYRCDRPSAERSSRAHAVRYGSVARSFLHSGQQAPRM